MYSRWMLIIPFLVVISCFSEGSAAQDTMVPNTWPIAYHDAFDNDGSGWKVRVTENAVRSYSDDSYGIEITDDSRVAWSRIPGARSFRDFVAEVEVRDFEGQGQFGVVFRYRDGDNFYCFAIRTNGDFRFRKQQDDEWDTLIDWTPSGAIQLDGANHLKVVAVHDTLTFSLNGIQLAEVNDAEYFQGEIGLLAGTLEESWFKASFDALTVRTDPEAAALAAVCGAEMRWPLATLGISYVHALAFSPNGRYLAIGVGDVAELIDTDEWAVTRILYGHEGAVESVAFSPNGDLLATGSQDGTVRIWHVETGELHAILLHGDREETLLGPQAPAVLSTTFSPDGAMLATGNGDGTVRVWDLSESGSHSVFRGHAENVNSVAFSPDGRLLVSGSKDRTVRAWDLVTGQSTVVNEYRSLVTSVAFAKDGELLAVGLKTGGIELVDVRTHAPLVSFDGHPDAFLGGVQSLAFSPTEGTLASCAWDGTARLWDVSMGQQVACLEIPALEGVTAGAASEWMESVAFSPDGHLLAVGGSGTLSVWDVSSTEVIALRTAHALQVADVAFSPTGEYLASASRDGAIKLWDVAENREMRELHVQEGQPDSVEFNPDGTVLAVAVRGKRTISLNFVSEARYGAVELWDVGTGHAVAILDHPNGVRSVSFSSDGHLLASADRDGTVRIWDVSDVSTAKVVNQLRALDNNETDATAVAFSPDDLSLCSAYQDGVIRIWDVRTGSLIQVLRGHTQYVGSVAFNPDGRLLASGSVDDTVRVWDVTTGKELAALKHTGNAMSVAFSPDGAILAAGGQTCPEENAIRLWDLASYRVLCTFGTECETYAIAFSPLGDLLASGTGACTVDLWDVSTFLGSNVQPDGNRTQPTAETSPGTAQSAGASTPGEASSEAVPPERSDGDQGQLSTTSPEPTQDCGALSSGEDAPSTEIPCAQPDVSDPRVLSSPDAATSPQPPRAFCGSDVYSSIQVAIDASDPGDEITLEAGVYAECLRIEKSIRIVGAGEDATILTPSPEADAVIAVDGIDTWVFIEDLAVDACGQTSATGISARGQSTVEITGCTLKGSPGAIGGFDSSRIVVSDTTFLGGDGVGTGIYLEDDALADVDTSVFDGVAAGITTRGHSVLTARDCSILRSQYGGVVAIDSAQVSLTRCTIEGSGEHGIHILNDAHVSLFECDVTASEKHGLFCVDQSCANVNGSTISASGMKGVYAEGESRATIVESVISQNEGDGVGTAGDAYVEMRGSVCEQNGRIGIGAWQNAEVICSETSLTNNGYGFYSASSNSFTLSACSVRSNERQGMMIVGDGGGIIASCDISGNHEGIDMSGPGSVVITGSSIEMNDSYGLRSARPASVEGSGNRMRGNGCDLLGDIPSTFRLPLTDAAESHIELPNEAYPTLQHAVDALHPGGMLVLRAGEYIGGVTIGKPITLRGASAESTEIRGGLTAAISLVCDAELVIEDISLAGEGEEAGIAASGNAAVRAARIRVRGFRAGLEFADRSRGDIRECTVVQNLIGLWAHDLAEAFVGGSVFSENTRFGINADEHSIITGAGNRMELNGCDLAGDVDLSLRDPLRSEAVSEIAYPNDSNLSLQETIDMLSPGGILLLGEGEYVAGLTIGKALTIRAAEGCTPTLSAPSPDSPVLSLINQSELALSGIDVSGGLVGIFADGNSRARVEKCSISGALWTGVYLGGSSSMQIEGCQISENDTGIYLLEDAHLSLGASTVSLNAYGIITFSPACGYSEASTEFEGFRGIIDGSGNLILDNEEADLCPAFPGPPWPDWFTTTAILHVPEDYTTIADAVADADAGAMILVGEGVYQERLVLDKPVHVKGASRDDVVLLGDLGSVVAVAAQGVRLESLTVSGGDTGILARGDAVLNMHDTRVTGSALACVLITEAASASMVSCRVEDSLGVGVSVDTLAALDASECVMSGHAGTSIEVREGATARLVECTMSESAYGLDLRGGSSTYLSECKIVRNREDGILLAAQSELAMWHCTVESNRGYAVRSTAFDVTSHPRGLVHGGGNLLSGPVSPSTLEVLSASDGAALALGLVLTVPDDYASIQAAIEAAVPGDTVFIRQGHYRENLRISKPITLRGERRTGTFLESVTEAPVVQILLAESGASAAINIENLTIRRDTLGVGIACNVEALSPQAGSDRHLLSVRDVSVIGCSTGMAASGWPDAPAAEDLRLLIELERLTVESASGDGLSRGIQLSDVFASMAGSRIEGDVAVECLASVLVMNDNVLKGQRGVLVGGAELVGDLIMVLLKHNSGRWPMYGIFGCDNKIEAAFPLTPSADELWPSEFLSTQDSVDFQIQLRAGTHGITGQLSFSMAGLTSLPYVHCTIDGEPDWLDQAASFRESGSYSGYVFHGGEWPRWISTEVDADAVVQSFMEEGDLSPGEHTLSAALYLAETPLPSSDRFAHSVPLDWQPHDRRSTTFSIPAFPESSEGVLISSVPLGAEVYFARDDALGVRPYEEVFESRFAQGAAPMIVEAEPGTYWVGFEIAASSGHDELLFEADEAFDASTVFNANMPIAYRRVYRLDIPADDPAQVIGLFQVLGSRPTDLLHILSPGDRFRIDSQRVGEALEAHDISSVNCENLVQILGAGGKVVLKDISGPLPLAFVDRYSRFVVEADRDGDIHWSEFSIQRPADAGSEWKTPDIANDTKRILTDILLKPALVEDVFGRTQIAYDEFGPFYVAGWNILERGRRIAEGGESTLLEQVSSLLSCETEIDRQAILASVAPSDRSDVVSLLVFTVESRHSSEYGSGEFFFSEEAARVGRITVEAARTLNVGREHLALSLFQSSVILYGDLPRHGEEVLRNLNEVCALYEKMPGLEVGAALAYEWLGFAQQKLGQYSAARQAFLSSCEWLGRMPETHNEDLLFLARHGKINSLRNAARASIRLGDYEEALSLLDRADGLGHTDVDLRAKALLALGRISDALEIFREEATAEFSKPSWRASFTPILNFAASLALIGESDEAVAILNQSPCTNSGDALLQLGRILLLSGDYQASRLCLETALAGFEFGKNTPAESECLISLATVCALMQDGACFNDVRAEIDSWLTIMGDHVSTDLSARIHRHMSFAHYLLGEFDMAIAECMEAIANDETLADSENLWRDFFLLSLYESERGHTEESRLHLVHSLELVEKLSCEIERVAFRQAFLGERRLIYERLIDECVEAGELKTTFNISERARARTFLDLLAIGPIDTLENVAEEGIRSGVVTASVIEKDLAEVVAGLPEDTAALEYFVTDTATYVWVIYQGEIQGPIQLDHGRAELMHKVIDTREQLGSSPEHPFNPRNLIELYDWLIRPVEHLLPSTTGEGDVPHLIIIPSGPLYYLPFQALIWTSEEDLTENAPLIVRYALSYSPSLATLKYAQALADTAYPQATFLALADPDSGDPRLPDAQTEARMVAQLFTVSSVYVDSDATEDVVQSDSATARDILLSTHGLFNPHNPMFSYLVVSPTDRNSDGKLYAYEVFTLPLHANMVVLSACETLLPSIDEMEEQVHKIARRGPEDERKPLTDDQLEALTAGDEVVGLTRAFISAGASSVLSSLWSVPSGSTAQLMVSFYKHREKGMDKAQALRVAQLEVMNTIGCTQPWYWAAFNLMGDWR